ncbi:MAG: ABC transporter permease, partial [Coprobacillus sp.]|nr:ABC transporter permease [Coprobacillus sp.]
NFDIYVRNDNWNYYDTYRIRLAGFTLGNSNAFYHYNHKWNTVIYSDLYYDFSEYVGEEHETPWTMEEIHYLECLDNAEEVYELSLHDETFSNAFLDKGSSDYFYNFENYDYDEEIYSNRLLAFCNTYEYLSPNTASEIIENEPNITSVVYGNDMGYALYGSYFMTGFAREMYFSFNYDSIMEVDNYLSAYNLESGTDFNPDSSVLKGHYTQVASTGVVFSPLDEEEIYMGRPPNDIGEVAISTAFLDAVELDYEKALNLEELCVLYDYEDNYLANNSVRKDFKEDVLHVVGIIESDQIAIYQDSDWLISYFMFTYDVSSFSLVPYSLAFNIKDVNKMDETIEALEEYLPGYTVYNPVSQLSESVREVSDYISLGILIISVVALIASALLIFAMINILIIENKRDFGLLRCIGVNSKQSFKMVVGYGLYLSISSFILSVIELIVVVLVLSFTTSSISFGMSFFTSLIWMALIAVIVSLVACALQYRKITRLDPLEAIKR